MAERPKDFGPRLKTMPTIDQRLLLGRATDTKWEKGCVTKLSRKEKKGVVGKEG